MLDSLGRQHREPITGRKGCAGGEMGDGPIGRALAASIVKSWRGDGFPTWTYDIVHNSNVFYTDMLFTDKGCMDAVLVKLTTKMPGKIGDRTHCYACGVNNEVARPLRDRCCDAALKACENLAKFLRDNQ